MVPAADVIPPEEAIKIPKEEQIWCRVVFTDKNEIARASYPGLPFAPKTHLCARGFQESALPL